MFLSGPMMLPGGGQLNLTAYRYTSTTTQSGRVVKGDSVELGGIKGILASANALEKERWKQLSHPVSHKIIQKGIPDFELKAGDFFVYGVKKYHISAVPDNVGGLNHFTIYYCEERSDLA